MAITPAAEIPTLSLLYKLNKLVAPPTGTRLPVTQDASSTSLPVPSKRLNDHVAVIRGDITSLAVDAIVNAANRSLLGGGGVDGAIHRAAGPRLLAECRRLNGCETGSAKITDAYNLPCKKVIHAVGPIYDMLDPDISEAQLAGCYRKGLELAAASGCRTIAFSAISTGVYGYPSKEAAPVAISTVRKFLEKSPAALDKVIFVTFEKKDVDAYNEFLPQYFPPVPEDSAVPKADSSDKQVAPESPSDTDAKIEAEAKSVVGNLPSVPTADPSDNEHREKKQKHDGA